MTCRELIGFLCDYLVGRLAEDQTRAFEEHLARCPRCVAFLNDLGAIARLARCARAAEDRPAPDEVPTELVAAVEEARSGAALRPFPTAPR